MDRTEALDQLRIVVGKVTGHEVPALDADTRLLEDLALDSTGIMETLIELEDTFGFRVDVDTLDPAVFRTAGSLADYVGEMTAAADVAG
ncbi:hypothetical protein BLA60_36895 [Actinophytocola xinjiangensis]|uniref:Carrier domain-containing protein n=1 Tax=Actinophytocola xinjiangensis TaxID=485602 RepID=A0A7Z1AU69_9PSEU|nr:phosphopantetheine-binding protein [Actinophytocola xinjiangensis]OLF05238.1 hypothetical protein BLA60_36895 [Actinophytocola xinjiangensis]